MVGSLQEKTSVFIMIGLNTGKKVDKLPSCIICRLVSTAQRYFVRLQFQNISQGSRTFSYMQLTFSMRRCKTLWPEGEGVLKYTILQ